jgi:multicopper oxidase
MDRRDFLKVMAGSCAGAMSAQVLHPFPARAADSDTVHVTLTAWPYRFSPAPHVSFSGLAYNGQMPGPLLRVRYGQRLRAHFINHSGLESTVHWHGMILPNDMDGMPNVTQKPVPDGGEFLYEFKPNPPGFRWYHSHVSPQLAMGLLGPFIVEDPREERADVEVVLVFHDVPDMASFRQALAGVSKARMIAPAGSPEMMRMQGQAMSGGMSERKGKGGTGGGMDAMMKTMTNATMGDEVAYLARCINGATYPRTEPITVRVGQRVRLRILNASPTLTHYIALGGHRLRVTHSDGNPMPRAVEVDALRAGVAERYDAWFEVTRPGAWLLEAIASDGMAIGQSVRVYTPGMEHAEAVRPPQSVKGVDYFTYPQAGDAAPAHRSLDLGPADVQADFTLGHDAHDTSKWTINGAVWPHTPKILVHPRDRVLVRFHNPTDMDHPMHLHGHVFRLVAVNGRALRSPLPKDVALVSANGGTAAWLFEATSPPGRWVLHCHNSVHLADGMMTEVRYIDA